MAPPHPTSSPSGSPSRPDPWQVLGYLVAGVAFYGLVGWALDRWLGTTWLVAVGVLVGAGLGLYLTWRRLTVGDEDQHEQR
ncbi:MAG: AtpZ/AtpI family protein [Nocardioides sp.]